MKFCKDCRWFKESFRILGKYWGAARCAHPAVLDLVYGSTILACYTARKTYAKCKPEGLMWEDANYIERREK